MIEMRDRQRPFAISVLRVLLSLVFLTIGLAKLTGSLHTVQTFEAFGWGQWFRYLTGLVDVVGALLVFVPPWACYGALLLTCTIGLGAMLSWPRRADFLAACTLTVLAVTVAWLTRPRRVG